MTIPAVAGITGAIATSEYNFGLCGTEFPQRSTMKRPKARPDLGPRSATLGDVKMRLLLTDGHVAVGNAAHLVQRAPR